MESENLPLEYAFPSSLQSEARRAISYLAEDKRWVRLGSYDVLVTGEQLSIPQRIYHDPSGIPWWRVWGTKRLLLECLMTRHADGFTRQRYLQRIIRRDEIWIPPFVVLLVGEYVVEILNVIWENRQFLDRSIYGDFLRSNADLWHKTQQRIVSYWDCYYRSVPKKEYAGFRLTELFNSIAKMER